MLPLALERNHSAIHRFGESRRLPSAAAWRPFVEAVLDEGVPVVLESCEPIVVEVGSLDEGFVHSIRYDHGLCAEMGRQFFKNWLELGNLGFGTDRGDGRAEPLQQEFC